jgi:hypothetical protein
VFQFEVAFDFNHLTFMPISSESVVPLQDLNDRQLCMITSLKAAAAIVKFKLYEMAIRSITIEGCGWVKQTKKFTVM